MPPLVFCGQVYPVFFIESYHLNWTKPLEESMKNQLALLLAIAFLGVAVNAQEGAYGRRGSQRPTMMNYSDSDLASMARRSLERDTTLSHEARNVNIKIRDGRAVLQGAISSPEEGDILKKKVMAVEGVRDVQNNISIQE